MKAPTAKDSLGPIDMTLYLSAHLATGNDTEDDQLI